MLLTLMLLAAPAGAQSVAGRVVDAATGAGLGGAHVALLDSAGTPTATTLSDSAGAFYLPAAGGTFRLEARLLGFATNRTAPFAVGAQERVQVELRLSVEAVALAPLEVVARRIDPRHLATLEGFLRRWEELPAVGPRRAVRREGPEMESALALEDIVAWFGEASLSGTLYWNGHKPNPGLAAYLRDIPIEFLEGVEFYRREIDAPLEYRSGAACAASHRCPVLALWGRLPDGMTLEEVVAEELVRPAEPPPGLPETAELGLRIQPRVASGGPEAGASGGVGEAMPAGTLRGAVLDAGGVPAGGAIVELVGPAGERMAITRAGEDGAFTFTAPAPGSYHLRALHADHGAATTPAFELGEGQAADVLLTFVAGG